MSFFKNIKNFGSSFVETIKNIGKAVINKLSRKKQKQANDAIAQLQEIVENVKYIRHNKLPRKRDSFIPFRPPGEIERKIEYTLVIHPRRHRINLAQFHPHRVIMPTPNIHHVPNTRLPRYRNRNLRVCLISVKCYIIKYAKISESGTRRAIGGRWITAHAEFIIDINRMHEQYYRNSIVDKVLKEYLRVLEEESPDSYIDVIYQLRMYRKLRWEELPDRPFNLADIEMSKKTYPIYELLPQNILNKHDSECVIDAIMAQIQLKNYTRDKLKSELDKIKYTKESRYLNGDIDGYSANHILKWAQEKKKFSVYVFDILGNLMSKYISASNHVCGVIMIYSNNGHAYIIPESLKNDVIKKNKIELHRIYNEPINMQNIEIMNNKESEVSDFSTKYGNTNTVLVDTIDLNTCMTNMIEKTGVLPTVLKFHHRQNILLGFNNPTTQQLFIAAPEIHQRTKICNELNKLYEAREFLTPNITYRKIMDTFIRCKIGNIPNSKYGYTALKILKHYPIKQKIEAFGVARYDYNAISLDIPKCYTSCCLHMTHHWPIYSMHDTEEKFNGKITLGEYYINRKFNIMDGKVEFPHGYYSACFVAKLVEDNIISLKDITHQYKPTYFLPKDIFNKPFTEILKYYPKEAKLMINQYIGSWDKRSRRYQEGAITNDILTAISAQYTYTDKIHIQFAAPYYIIRRSIEEPIFEGNSFMNRAVICMSYLKLHNLYKLAKQHYNITNILGCHCDSIQFEYDKIIKPLIIDNTPGGVRTEPSVRLCNKQPLPEPPKLEDIIIPNDKISKLILGGAGSGKTTFLTTLFNEHTINLNYTNKATVTVQNKAKSEYKEKCSTFDAYLCKKNPSYIHINKLLHSNRILVDEFMMVPERFLFELFQAKYKNPKLEIIIAGDPLQCLPPYDEPRDYLNSDIINFICPNRTTLKYIKHSNRFINEETINEHLRFIKEKKIIEDKENPHKLLPNVQFTICKTRAMRKKINKEKLNGRKIFTIGNPIIGLNNNKRNNCYNSQRYWIISKGLRKSKLQIDETKEIIEIDTKLLTTKLFRSGYADTVYRSQGMTIDTEYNIVEVNKMSFNQFHTARTRGRNLAKVGYECKDKEFIIENTKIHKNKLLELTPLYHNGYIYKITFKVDKNSSLYYIGQTDDIARRIKEHIKKPTNKAMAEAFKKYEYTYEIIDSVSYINEHTLNKLEYYYIQSENADLLLNEKLKIKKATQAIVPSETKIINRFNITDYNSSYIIQYRHEGVKCIIRAHYGKNQSKENALIEITKKKEELIKTLY
jgi:predicted GIY-YIG superfamily endonuclease